MDGGRMGLIFGTGVQPSGTWALTGSGSKISPTQSALLVSDPILCLPSGGELQFRYWTTPQTKIRVCTRSPGKDGLCCNVHQLVQLPPPVKIGKFQ